MAIDRTSNMIRRAASRVRAAEADATYSAPSAIDDLNARLAPLLEEADELLFGSRGEALTDPTKAGSYFKARLVARPNEIFAVLFLDARHRPLGYEEMFVGTIHGAEVHPREVVKAALRYNASSILIGHQHPSGDPSPSADDRLLTVRLRDALRLVDVRLLDHFVIGKGAPLSMARRGWV